MINCICCLDVYNCILSILLYIQEIKYNSSILSLSFFSLFNRAKYPATSTFNPHAFVDSKDSGLSNLAVALVYNDSNEHADYVVYDSQERLHCVSAMQVNLKLFVDAICILYTPHR